MNPSIDAALAANLTDVRGGVPGKLSGRFMFAADFPAFEGHFPGQPVLPGVVQMAAVRGLLQRVLSQDLTIASCSRIKFRDAVVPGDDVMVEAQVDAEAGGYAVRFSLTRGDKPISAGRLLLKEAS